jgi:hypothetical protein
MRDAPRHRVRDTFLRRPDLPALLWLRLIVGERLAICQRRHLGATMRDAAQEVSLDRDPLPRASSAALASMLLGRLTLPSHAAVRADLVLQVQEALNALDPWTARWSRCDTLNRSAAPRRRRS